MPMKNPPHPGRIVRQECIEPLGLSITEAAERLGVKRQTLNNLVQRQGRDLPADVDTSVQGLRQPPGGLAGLQMQYDLAQAEQ